jgi:hypothetical protein
VLFDAVFGGRLWMMKIKVILEGLNDSDEKIGTNMQTI